MRGSHERHIACEHNLERRLRTKYPGDLILCNVHYFSNDTLKGELDILRITPFNSYVVYEVKTSIKGHYAKAKKQIRRFEKYIGEEVQGVYYHPERGVKRL